MPGILGRQGGQGGRGIILHVLLLLLPALAPAVGIAGVTRLSKDPAKKIIYPSHFLTLCPFCLWVFPWAGLQCLPPDSIHRDYETWGCGWKQNALPPSTRLMCGFREVLHADFTKSPTGCDTSTTIKKILQQF